MSISLTVDIGKWAAAFKGQIEETKIAVDHTMESVSKQLYKRIVDYTPIGNPNLWHPPYWPKGYTPGQLKASWVIEKEGLEYKIKNEQPYAMRVEYGWSTQAPEGMMRRAIEEYPILVGRTATEYKI